MRSKKKDTPEKMLRRILRVAVLLVETQQEEAMPQESSMPSSEASEKHESSESL
ncbi:MAG: hypothetical protein JNL42_02445 [Anaerolineae bacterium]|nr:hypothetical protein [Anaerolineae bacterium]